MHVVVSVVAGEYVGDAIAGQKVIEVGADDVLEAVARVTGGVAAVSNNGAVRSKGDEHGIRVAGIAQRVDAAAAMHLICVVASDDRVVAAAAVNEVFAIEALENVVSAETVNL